VVFNNQNIYAISRTYSIESTVIAQEHDMQKLLRQANKENTQLQVKTEQLQTIEPSNHSYHYFLVKNGGCRITHSPVSSFSCMFQNTTISDQDLFLFFHQSDSIGVMLHTLHHVTITFDLILNMAFCCSC
jgi:hypothetical protein